jgi:hypothetical protein
MTVEQVAGELLCSPSKVSRMETGSRGATLRDVRDLCDLYQVADPAQRERLARLASEGRQPGWWQSYDLVDHFMTYVGLEAEAAKLIEFRCMIIPGLLQTPQYAKAMHGADVAYELSTQRIEELIEVRLTRQRLLTRDPPLQMEVVIDEAMLHRVVGGPAVMAGQVDRLIEAANMPNVTIQVISNEIGAHPAMDSNFNILEFDDAGVPSVAYTEGLVGFLYLERSQDLARYRRVLERLRTVALTPQGSVELMKEIAAQYKERADVR